MTGDETSPDPWTAWRTRLETSRRRREEKVGDWQENVSRRVGEPTGTSTTSTLVTTTPRSHVNKDWPLTKAKIALLYSQTPEIRLTTEDPRAAEIVPKFAKDLNSTIRTAEVGAAIEEELADVINAAGIGGVVIACEKRTEPRTDPITGMDVQIPIDIRYPVRHLSSACLLIPTEFNGSVYDQARWLGYDDSMAWATAQVELGLTEDQKDKVLGTDRRATGRTTLNTDAAKYSDAEAVNFTEIFYWRHYYHADETNFRALQRLVFVEGLEEPVIDEPYAGQRRLPAGQIVGVVRNPIQILTVTYVSDENLPPSDSTISRGSVRELEESRTQMALQRKHSNPLRWGDTNRVSANARARIDKGDFQSFIWTNGPGDRAIGEVARASFPQEKYELDAVINREITDQWQTGPNQIGSFASGERSAREAGIVERNFQTRIGQERAKVERHFVAIAEILGALMALHGNAGMPAELLGAVTYSIRVDSTVLLDAEQRIARVEKQIDRLAQSPFADVRPLIREWLELNGTDPTHIIIDPQPKPPEPVKVSVSKAEDLNNLLFLAALVRTQQAPTPDDLAAAVKLQQAALAAAAPPVLPPMPDTRPPLDAATPGLANPDWVMAPRMDKRDEDGGA